MQLTASFSVAKPTNWKNGEDAVKMPSVKTADISFKFPKEFTEIKTYLRTTPRPNL